MDFLNVDREQIEKVRKCYNITEAQIKENVEIIKAWKAKQPHLPIDMSDDLIEKFLLRNKFKVERTKEKIDSYFSLRGSNRDFFQHFETIVPTNEATGYLPMTTLTPKLERVIIWKLLDTDPEHFDLFRAVRCQMAVDELCLRNDYAIGVRYFLDTEGFTFKHLLKINPLVYARLLWLEEKVFSNRMLGIDFINFPPFASKLMALFKAVMKPKIYNRIAIYENLESLHKVIPKECLPSEYGGNAGDIPQLLRKMDVIIKNHRDFFLKNYDYVSREELRPVEMYDNVYGVEGTFKKLAID